MFVCKAKTIEVLVACDFELQQSGEPPSSQFQMKIKDNIYIKGLRRMIEDRIVMSSLTIMTEGCDGDDRMLCELDKEIIPVVIYKMVHLYLLYF